MAQATYTITYNGYTLFEPIIDSYESEPVLADDGIRIESIRHKLSGQAVIAGTTGANYKTEYDSANQKLLQPTGDLLVRVTDESGTDSDLVDITAPDDFDGPHGRFNITKAIGIRASIAQFEIVWHEYAKDTGTVQDVLSHRWQTTFDYDEVNTCVMTITGIIRIRASANSTSAGTISTDSAIMVGNNPDAYRLAISPPLPSGFRRTKQSFAIDESGNRLIYTIEATQGAVDLPSPALDGESSFRWDQSRQDMIGKKVFEVTLTGDTKTSTAKLLKAGVLMSKNRIRWGSGQSGGSGIDMIESISIEEMDMFAAKRMRFRVTARAVPNSDSISMPNASLLTDIMAGISDRYSDISPYGSARIREIRRTLRDPTFINIDTQTTEANEEAANTAVPTALYSFPGNVFDALESNLVDAGQQSDQTRANANHVQNPYIMMDIKEHLDIRDTGMITMGSRSPLAREIALQVRNPVVLLISEARMSRVGKAPRREFLAPPPGAILISQKANNLTPKADANGNMIFTTIQRRVLKLLYTPGTGGFITDSGGRVTYWSPTNAMRMGFDPRTELAASGNYTTPAANRSIPIGEREPYVT